MDEVLVIMVIGLFILLIAAVGVIVSGNHPQTDNSISISFQATREVYDSKTGEYHTEIIKDRGNGRRIDGHPLQSKEDWEKWARYVHKAYDVADIVRECENKLNSYFCDEDPEIVAQRAKENYAEYERLCSKYGIWNSFIGDRTVYIPTSEQREKSIEYLQGITDNVPLAQKKRAQSLEAEKIVLKCIDQSPKKIAFKKDARKMLTNESALSYADAGKAITVLKKRNVIKETKDESGRALIRKTRKRKPIKGNRA